MIKLFDFVSVVYNNYEDTYDFCHSLSRMRVDSGALRCVIVDNSTELSVSARIDDLKVVFPFVEVLRPGGNLGYFGAFNYYFESNLFDKSRVVIICNNDLVFESDFCLRFLSAAYPDDVLVVCPDVLTRDGIHQNPHVLSYRSGWSRLRLDIYFLNYYLACGLRVIQRWMRFFASNKVCHEASPGYVHMGIGACYVLTDKFFSYFSHLDYPHFLYGEEAYLTRQVHSVGGKLFYDPSLKVLHKESATLSKLPSRVTYEFAREGYWDYRRFY